MPTGRKMATRDRDSDIPSLSFFFVNNYLFGLKVFFFSHGAITCANIRDKVKNELKKNYTVK